MQSNVARNGMAVTPHHLATQSAVKCLQSGGNAIEATVAAAASSAVVYPHMNSLGGDGFWLILPKAGDPISIHASGPAGSKITIDDYTGLAAIPHRGPAAALTVAVAISGWQQALQFASQYHATSLPLTALLADAIHYAYQGIPVTASQTKATRQFQRELQSQPGFSETYLQNNQLPELGERFLQPKLGETLEQLCLQGLDSFYRGPLAKKLAEGMQQCGMRLELADLEHYQAAFSTPLKLNNSLGTLYNLSPPTQGLASLAILGICEQFSLGNANETDTIHLIVEATKQAFQLRDRYIGDPRITAEFCQQLLDPAALQRYANQIDPNQAAAWGGGQGPGDTVWLGVVDTNGLAVSYIQSIYHEFGRGVVIPETGIVWQNRGAAFLLDPNHILTLAPGKYPFHTLNPAAARLNDGRNMVYGSMGGDGQPQTQAALLIRYLLQGISLQSSITRPRWLLGRTWGQDSDSLKLEGRFSPTVIETLRARGHKVEVLEAYTETMGHAGAIVAHPNGSYEGAFDPRSNGSATGF